MICARPACSRSRRIWASPLEGAAASWHDRAVTIEDTALAATEAEVPRALGSQGLISLEMRTSVLPRTSARAITHGGPRFEPMRVIGRGGLGEVTLVRDHDTDVQRALVRRRL